MCELELKLQNYRITKLQNYIYYAGLKTPPEVC